MALRTFLRAWRRRLVILAAILSIGGLVAVHHTGVHPMDDRGMHALEIVVELCLAVLPLAAAALALRRSNLLPRLRRSFVRTARPNDLVALLRLLLPRTRAGPMFLSVMRR